MNAAPPSFTNADLARLRDRLSALAAGPGRYTECGRVLPVGDRSAIAAIRAEISETQAPRQLEFHNGRDETLTVEVRAGRLLRIISAPPGAIELNEIDETDQATLHSAAETLRLFAVRSAALTVRSVIIAAAAQRPASGVAIEKLLTQDDVPTAACTQAAQEARIAALVSVASKTALALLHLQSGVEVTATGAPEKLVKLRQLAASENANPNAASPNSDTSPTEHCVIFSAHPDRDRTILCAALNAELVFILMRTGSLAGICAAWASG